MATKKNAQRGSRAGFEPWSRATLAPVVLLLGKQRVFAQRAIASLRAAALDAAEKAGAMEPPEITEVNARTYESSRLSQLTSPSLFGGMPLVIIPGLEQANAELLQDLEAYLKNPASDAYLVLWHAGGNHGKKVLDLCKGGTAKVYACDELRWPEEKAQFLQAEAGRLGRPISQDAVAALVAALGDEFEELLSVTTQLLQTVGNPTQPLSLAEVDQYLQGRVEATGFNVADAAVTGNVGEALRLLRHALATGVAPVLIVSAMATKLRQILTSFSTQLPPAVAQMDLVDPPKPLFGRIAQGIRAVAPRWDDERLGLAILAVARADEAVKGASRDPEYALEAMVLAVCRYASGVREPVGTPPTRS